MVVPFPRGLALLVAGALFMEILDATVIATALPSMSVDFGVTPTELNIAISVYLLTLAVVIPVNGWMAGKYGVRRVFLGALAVFTAASVGCALSPSLPVLILMRIVQGCGGAMMVPVGRLAVLRTVEKKDLVRAIAFLIWPALVAPVLAPLIGGVITTYFSWRWIFIVNVPLGIAGFVVGHRLLKIAEAPFPRPLDGRGLLLCASGIAALLLGLDGVRVSGTSWTHVVVGVVVAAVLLTWATRHLMHTPDPLLDLSVLRIRTFRSTAIFGSLYRMVLTAVPFVLPLMFQLRFGWSPFVSGAMVAALFVGNVGIKPVTTTLMRRFGIRRILAMVAALSVLCFGALALVDERTPPSAIAVILVISGALRSVGFTAYNSLTFADVDSDRLTDANTLDATNRELFGGIGIALGAIVLTLSTSVVSATHAPAGREYAFTFGVLGMLMLVMLVGAFRLPHDAGAHVTDTKS